MIPNAEHQFLSVPLQLWMNLFKSWNWPTHSQEELSTNARRRADLFEWLRFDSQHPFAELL